jgi:CRISPR-associated protein Csx17
LRLVGEQLDADATGRWDEDTFIIRSYSDAARLEEFFLNEYRPTPIVSPWNGRSGFNTARSRKSEQLLGYVETSKDQRLAQLRAAISVGRDIYEIGTKEEWDKDRWVQACRANFPDDAVKWLDAVAVLTDDRVVYPFLLGTGGNLGSMDLSNNFIERLGDALGLPHGRKAAPEEVRTGWLRAALFAKETSPLVSAAPGQFNPGSKARELVNPWDFVLTIEGSLLFASGAARRMGAGGTGTIAMPFMVGASAVGFPSNAEDERARGEMWAPVWDSPVSCSELARLIGEGRSSWGRRQARNGLDFARAAASLGVDRGVDSFERFSFLERHGQDMIAVPSGTIVVRHRPEALLLSHLDRWIDSVRRLQDVPSGIKTVLRRISASQFEVATGGGSKALQDVLVAVAVLESLIARSSKMWEQVRSPVPRLAANQWLPLLDDGSGEFRLAAALASQEDRLPFGAPDDFARKASSVALLLRPMILSDRRALTWSNGPARVPGLGVAELAQVLSAALRLRMRDAMAKPQRGDGTTDEGQVGVEPAFDFAIPAAPADIAAFVAGETDDRRISDLLSACLLFGWRDRPKLPWVLDDDATPSPSWALIAPFFAHREQSQRGPVLRAAMSWPQQLITGRVEDVVEDALRRLRIARLDPAPRDHVAISADVDGRRLAAALLFPISRNACNVLLRRTLQTESTAAPQA